MFFLSRLLRLHEILEFEKSIGEDSGGEKGGMKRSENIVTVYITPPEDGNETNEDYGEEYHVEISNLLSGAELRIHEPFSTEVDKQEDNAPLPSSSKSISRMSGR